MAAKDAVPAAVQERDSGLLDGLQAMMQGGTAPAADAGAEGAAPAGQRA